MRRNIEKVGEQVGKPKSGPFNILRSMFSKPTQASESEPLLGSSSGTDVSSTFKQAEGIDISSHTSLEQLKPAAENFQKFVRTNGYSKQSLEKQRDYGSRIQNMLNSLTLAKNSFDQQEIQKVINDARDLEMDIKNAIIGTEKYNFVTQQLHSKEELSGQGLTPEELTWIVDIANDEVEKASKKVIGAKKYRDDCMQYVDDPQRYSTYAGAAEHVQAVKKKKKENTEKANNAQANYDCISAPEDPN